MGIPDIIITCLGNFKNFKEIQTLVKKFPGEMFEIDEEFSEIANDDRMPDAFEVSEPKWDKSLTKTDLESIENHSAFAYVIAKKVKPSEKISGLKTALTLIGELIESKLVTAVKFDRSGIAHGLDFWKARAAELKKVNDEDALKILFRTFVLRPMTEDDEMFYSLGMHLFGKPDFLSSEKNEKKLLHQMDEAFALSMFAGHQSEKVKLGSPKKNLEIYEEDDILFNPFGYQEMKTKTNG